MRVVVIGGTGRIGSRVSAYLRSEGHEVAVASLTTGVNAATGEGLEAALAGADILIDVSNASAHDPDAALAYFNAAGQHIRAAKEAAGIRHHLVLSVVGAERLLDSKYFQGKMLQEARVKASTVPYTILRSTQFFEFVRDIVQTGERPLIHLPDIHIQPVAADEVARYLAILAISAARNATVEYAGPEVKPLGELAEQVLTFEEDTRPIRVDAAVGYYGARVTTNALLPERGALAGRMTFDEWLVGTLAGVP